jgi:hypothetical protein
MRLIFAAIAAAVIAPMAVNAASTSTVSIGNPTGNGTALVTPTHQLQTVTTPPNNEVRAIGAIPSASCQPIYVPPAGKAIVVTQITYDMGTGVQGQESYGVLEPADCNDNTYDFADTVQGYEAQSHTFPTGMPMPSVGFRYEIGSNAVLVAISGYLIPATQLPPAPMPPAGPMKGMPKR